MNTEKLKQIYLDFALEMLNKEIRDFVVYQAPPHLQELYARLLTAFEEDSDKLSEEAEWFAQVKASARSLDELENHPTVYSWRSDNPYSDPVKAERWEQVRMMLMKQRT